LTPHLHNATWERGILEGIVGSAAEANGTSLGKLAGPLRAALSGRAVAPSVFDMMLVLGREETLARLKEVLERQG
jgi:glutamyl-tRNA synthetase